MDEPGCGGVRLTRGLTVTVTGWAYRQGKHVTKAESERLLRQKGVKFTDDHDGSWNLLIWGEFSESQIVNPSKGLTRKLERVWQRRAAGQHVHLVDTDDYAMLLAGKKVHCADAPDPGRLRSGGLRRPQRRLAGGYRRYTRSTRGSTRGASALTRDLAKLDKALRVHGDLEEKLADAALRRGLEPLSPVGTPQFDVAWREPSGALTVVEVKSLPEGGATQQIRLGIGQLIEYRSRLANEVVRAVLAVEHRPSSSHLLTSCESVGIIIVWPGRRLDSAFEG